MIRFTLRLPNELHSALVALAAKNRRPLAAEMRAALRRHVTQPAQKPLTERQRRTIYARGSATDHLTGSAKGTAVKTELAAAARHFDRPITSTSDLNAAEASWVLDRMERGG